MEAEGVKHRTVAVNGINMHVAEKGEGPVVLLIHGFPELWYSWRHQLTGLAAAGYRAVAPDLRGYGDTDAPPDISSYTIFHIVGDLVGLVHSLAQDQVFVVGHDWGAMVAWNLATFRPDMVRAVVSMSVPYRPRHPSLKPVAALRAACGDDYYVIKFQKPGAAEAEFAKAGCSNVLKRIVSQSTPRREDKDHSKKEEEAFQLPSWLTEEDINYYTSKYEKSGFTGGLNYYRNLDLNWELMAPWTGAQVSLPAKFIIGDLDLVYNVPGMAGYIHNQDGFKKDVPGLQDLIIMKGVGHFLNQEKPKEITDHILDFISKF